MVEREEIDLDQLMAEAESVAAEADVAFDRLASTELPGGGRIVRTIDERRRAVFEAVEAATPDRSVRTPTERRAAVQRVLEERQREIERRRRERERAASEPEPVPPDDPPEPLRLAFPEHPPEVEAMVEATMRDREPRTAAQRLEDARRAAMEELERRRAKTAQRNRRVGDGHPDGDA